MHQTTGLIYLQHHDNVFRYVEYHFLKKKKKILYLHLNITITANFVYYINSEHYHT